MSAEGFRVYSHQESLVHLLWSGSNTMLIFFLFGAVHFHSALFTSEPEIVNKTTRVLKSSIHWTEILKQIKQQVLNKLIMEIFHSAIFIILLIWCYQILTQYEETYEHHMRQCHTML